MNTLPSQRFDETVRFIIRINTLINIVERVSKETYYGYQIPLEYGLLRNHK